MKSFALFVFNPYSEEVEFVDFFTSESAAWQYAENAPHSEETDW